MCYNVIKLYSSMSSHFSIQYSIQEAFLVNDYHEDSR